MVVEILLSMTLHGGVDCVWPNGGVTYNAPS